MIDEHEVREMLERRAGTISATPADAPKAVRRARRRLVLNGAVATVAAAVIAVTTFAGVDAIRSATIPADDPSEELGIFAPVAGRIVYGDGIWGVKDGIWGVDPTATADRAAQVQLTSDRATPLGWSRDGTELLIMRTASPDPNRRPRWDLSILHADGSETPVTTDPMYLSGATISPDGSRVVFAGDSGEMPEGGCCTNWGLYAVDADGGPAEVLLQARGVYEPTFSPDGTQIAYVTGGGDHTHHVWVMDADGSDAHEIVFNEWTDVDGHVDGLAWSPAGDRIALGLDSPAIYTFAPDGSEFTRVTTDGSGPYWSPDGSQIAYTIPVPLPYPDPSVGDLAIADADGSNVRTFGLATSGPWHPAPLPPTDPPSVPTDDVPPTPTQALAYGIDGDIYVANADGSNAVRIADGVPVDGRNNNCANGEQHAEYDASGTAWSPDGRYLAYWDLGCPVPAGAWGTVQITDPEGTLIASFPGEGWTISWSPDSARVAVWDSWGEGDSTIGVYGLDGVRQAALTVPPELTPPGDYSPAWSRDGASLLLPGVQVPLDGSTPRPLPADDLTHRVGWGVAYSPDGSSVAYLDHDGSLVVADADGPDTQEVGPTEFWDAAWSPNGDLVAFEADDTELLVRDVATGADTSLLDVTRSERLSVIEFSPDGDRILFTRSDADGSRSSLWSIGVDGSDLRRLLDGIDGIDWADLRPQGQPS